MVRRHSNAFDTNERKQAMLTSKNLSHHPLTRRMVLGAGTAGAVMATAGGVLAQQPAPAPQPPRVKGPLVWLDMDQKELDDAYDQSVYAPNAEQIVGRYTSNSESARARLGAPQRHAYGSAPIEALDVFPARRAHAPVNVFIHGGAWRSGSARNYAFLAELFVHAGACSARAGYSAGLAPAARTSLFLSFPVSETRRAV